MIGGPPLTAGHHIVRNASELAPMVRELQEAGGNIGFDFETDGLRYAMGDSPIGYSVGYMPRDGWPRCWYVPIKHRVAETQCPEDQARLAFKDALSGAHSLTGHNLKFDLNMGRANRFEIPENVPLHDTLMQGYLCYERRALNLEDLVANEGASRWANPHEYKHLINDFIRQRAKAWRIPIKKDKKKERIPAYYTRFGHSEVPIDLEGEYACRDVSHTLSLDAKLRSQAKGIGRVYEERGRVLYENEMLLVRALAEMEWHGQHVDRDYLYDLAAELEIEVSQRAIDLNHRFATSVDWTKDSQIRTLLYDILKLPVVKLTKGDRWGNNKQPAVDRESIEALRAHHPGLEYLSEFKARLTALNNFTYSLAWATGDDGRIHPSFRAGHVNSGRLSGRDPNFQNIPKRHKIIAKAIRKAWIIPEGRARVYVDYSQIELRMLAWITGAPLLNKVYESASYDAYRKGEINYDEYRWYRRSEDSVDVHASVCGDIFKVFKGDPEFDTKRLATKKVNFGLAYGGGKHLLTGDPDLRMDDLQAEIFLDQYRREFPQLKITQTRLYDKMKSRRGTPQFVNWAGRTVHGPRLGSDDDNERAEEERSMFACLVSGSAAELTRFSLVRWYLKYKSGEFPAVATSTVHDEIQYDCDRENKAYVASEAQRFMEDFPHFGRIPVVANVESTETSWDESKEYDFAVSS